MHDGLLGLPESVRRDPGGVCCIDPLTVGALVSAGIAGASGIGRAVGRATATRGMRRRNDDELERLQELESRNMLGLDATQRESLNHAMVSPMQQAALSTRKRAERIGAATQGAGFGARELSDIRQEQARNTGQAASAAGAQVAQLDLATQQQQEQEIEARLAARTAEQLQQLEAQMQALDSLAQAAGPIAGAVSQNQLGRSLAAQFDVGRLSDDEMARLTRLLGELDAEERAALIGALNPGGL